MTTNFILIFIALSTISDYERFVTKELIKHILVALIITIVLEAIKALFKIFKEWIMKKLIKEKNGD